MTYPISLSEKRKKARVIYPNISELQQRFCSVPSWVGAEGAEGGRGADSLFLYNPHQPVQTMHGPEATFL